MAQKHKKVPGVHIRWPWSQLIATGEKTIETRSYPLPAKYIGVELAIIETAGKRAAEAGFKSARIIGTVTFTKSFKYESRQAWEKDLPRHRVPKDDRDFAFSVNTEKWAWVVSTARKFEKFPPPPKRRGIVFALNCQI